MDIIMTILVGIFSAVSLGMSNAHAPSAADLLDKYAQNQDKLNSSVIVKFECDEKFFQNNEVYFDRVAPAEVRLDGQKYLTCVNYDYYDKVSDTTLPLDETDYRKFTLWDGERSIQYYDYVVRSKAYINRQDRPGAVFASAWPGSPLFGIRYHKAERIDTMLRQCETLSVRDEMETIGSEACYVIDAKSPTSTYTVWLNPKRGYSIFHAVIKHGPGTQGAFGVLSENEDRSLTVSDVRFQQIGSVHVPMVYNLYSERRRDGVVWRQGTVRGKVTDIFFNPDHEKLASFVPKMRDGTIIKDEDFAIVYKWYDGKLVPSVDEFVIEQIDRVTEDIMDQSGVPEGTVAGDKTEVVPNEPPATVDERPGTAESQREILSEFSPSLMLVFVLIVLSIIAIIMWRVFPIKRS